MKKNKQVKPKITKTKSNNNNIIIFFIILFAFILYGNTIRNDYSLDDDFVTASNETVKKGVKAIPEIFSSFYSNQENFTFGYRPMVKVSYAIEQQLFGANPHISHLINLLLYALTCIILFLFLKRILKNYHIIFPIAIIFLYMAHPLHTEVVASLKNRDEMFSFLGGITTTYLLIKFVDYNRIKYFIYAVFTYIFAGLSKESALCFLAIFPLTLYFFTNAKTKKIVIISSITLVGVFIENIIFRLVLGPVDRVIIFVENPLYFAHSIWTILATGLYSLICYIKLLIIPYPQLFYYGYNTIPVVDFTNGWALFSLCFHLGLFIYAIIKIKEKHILSFAILFYLIIMSSYANIVMPVMGIIGERYLYASSLSFCIIVAYFIFKLIKISPQSVNISTKISQKYFFILAIIIVPYTIKTIVRNKDWKNYMTLYNKDIPYLEKSAKANSLMAGMYLNAAYQSRDNNMPQDYINKSVDSVIFYYNRATSIFEGEALYWNNLGDMYFSFKKDTINSMKYFKKAIEVEPDYYKAHYNLGRNYEVLKKYDEAIKCYEKSIEIRPNYIKAILKLANLYFELNKPEKAIELNKRIFNIEPKFHLPYLNIAEHYLRIGDTITAIPYLEQTAERVSFDQKMKVYKNIYSFYLHRKDSVNAKKYYDAIRK